MKHNVRPDKQIHQVRFFFKNILKTIFMMNEIILQRKKPALMNDFKYF